MNIGQEIKLARQQMQWTQSNLAHKAGLSLATIQKIESGLANPEWNTLNLLFKFLGLEFFIQRSKISVEALIDLGVPLQSFRKFRNPASKEYLINELKSLSLNLTDLKKGSRESEAIASFLDAIQSHYPSVWNLAPELLQKWQTKQGAKFVRPKLRRIALSGLADYL